MLSEFSRKHGEFTPLAALYVQSYGIGACQPAARFWEQFVAGSATAVSFLLWLLYVHQASAQFAGHWTFPPALNAFLNG